MTPVLARLVVHRIMKTPLRSAALVVLFALAAAVLSVSIGLHGTAADAWDRAHRASRGGDLQIASFSTINAAAVRNAPGVVATSGPFTAHVLNARVDGRETAIALWAMPMLEDIEVDRPVVTAGRWPTATGDVALEQTFARALGARPGDEVRVHLGEAARTVRVAGLVATTRTPPYPTTAPGSVFVDQRSELAVAAAAAGVADSAAPRLSQVSVRFAPGTDRHAVTTGVLRSLGTPHTVATTAASIRQDSLAALRPLQVVLLSFGVLLAIGIALLVATLLSARLLDVARRVGQLRVAGLTTGQVVVVLASEHVLLAVVGAFAGTAVGVLLCPTFTAVVAETLGTTRVDVRPLTFVLVGLLLPGVTGAAAVAAAARWARVSLAAAVRGGGLVERKPSGLAAAALRRGRSAVAVVAIKEALAGRARTVALVLTVSLAVMAGVAALSMEASFDRADRQQAARAVQPSSGGAAPAGLPPMADDAGADAGADADADASERSRLRVAVYVLEALLAAVALGTLALTVATSVRERARELAVLRAVGFSPQQVVASVAASHGILAAVAAAIGVPAGFAFFRVAYEVANGAAVDVGWPSPLGILSVVIATVTIACSVAALATRLGSTSVTSALVAD